MSKIITNKMLKKGCTTPQIENILNAIRKVLTKYLIK